MTKLQQIMEDLFAVFREYAKRDGEDETLTKPEAKDLLKNQLPGLIENPGYDDEVRELVGGLDVDDGLEFGFRTFMKLVSSVASDRYEAQSLARCG
ncbi:protein S100-A12-like [Salarias fasciatus]|uniref:protein S100-A12-like n=1 Tax=Salarias fasciatus TaxID=181472 RepID=UPI0011768BAE|nr:protein S100-A12-like [Salarias fasciatus]